MKVFHPGEWLARLQGHALPGLGRAEGTAPGPGVAAPDRLAPSWWSRVVRAAQTEVERAAARPGQTFLLFLGLNAGLAVWFVAIGAALAGDPALLFRELGPGTRVSFCQLLIVAATAWALHRRDAAVAGRRWHDDLWGICAAFFLLFALLEISQGSLFLTKWLNQDFGLAPADGFHDLDAVLLTLLFSGCALLLASRARPLLQHPRALAVLVLGGLLGALSQGLDSVFDPTPWVVVAEESLKLSAEVFLIGGFVLILHDVLNGAGQRPPHEV